MPGYRAGALKVRLEARPVAPTGSRIRQAIPGRERRGFPPMPSLGGPLGKREAGGGWPIRAA